MPDRFLVSAIGVRVEVDVSHRDDDVRRRAFEAWQDALAAGDAPADAVVVVPPGRPADEALSSLSTAVTLAALDRRRADPVWLVHAAGVADASGRVVVLSAPSGTGKTTAARRLSQRYAYVSDETVAIGDRGRVEPYRKPLSVIEDPRAPKTQLALSRLGGGRPLPPELRVAKVVVLDRSADGPLTPVVEALELTEALELLAPQSSYLCDAEAPLQRIATVLEATGGAVRLRYREVDRIDPVIDDLLRTPAPVPAPASRERSPSVAPGSSGGPIVRGEVVDQVTVDGRTALLRRTPDGGRVHVLDGIGPAIWAAADGVTLAEIVAAVVSVHGEPPAGGAEEAVRDAVARLTAEGLLRDRSAQP